MPVNVTYDELLAIIGMKEVEIIKLRQEIQQMQVAQLDKGGARGAPVDDHQS